MDSDGRLSDALDKLWTRFLPQMEERLAALEAANHALMAHKLTVEQREAAHTAAHKLAGILGTFGLDAGTTLAREAEIHYHGDMEIDAHWAKRLSTIGVELRLMIDARRASDDSVPHSQ